MTVNSHLKEEAPMQTLRRSWTDHATKKPLHHAMFSSVKRVWVSSRVNALTFIENILLSIVFIIIALAFLMVSAHGQDTLRTEISEKAPSTGIYLNDLFTQADLIADGRIDSGEFDIHHFNVFKALDSNKDGRLVKDECLTDCITHRVWTGDKGAKETTASLRRLEFSHTPYRYDAIDIDGSGDIVIYEYILFGRERFSNFDKNKNGSIDNSEFCSGYKSSIPCDYSEKETLQ
jgi:hypothetical protein